MGLLGMNAISKRDSDFSKVGRDHELSELGLEGELIIVSLSHLTVMMANCSA